MNERVFHLKGTAAIPVGHRVEITIFALQVGAFSAKWEPQPYAPFVRDLDTGVVYARTWHYADATDDVSKLPLQPRTDLQVVERVVGVVRGARSLTGLAPGESGRTVPMTTLIVACESAR